MAFIKNHKSKYYLVKGIQTNEGIKYIARVKKLFKEPSFNTEKEAAIEVDKWLIKQGLEPKNILKRV